jgi:O-antigen chain-terminating methyltransferase
VAQAALRAAEESVYTAFENRFRGSREELRKRQGPDADLFRGLDPVADLGCGRGEFLELLREAGVAARGVDGNRNAVLECREKGLDVVEGDIVDFLRAHEDGSLGGVFAAQVVEHLRPPVLDALLAEAHRVLRKGGLLLLETVNARTATAFLEVYIRDVTHERPLHSETLAFMVAAHGFTDVHVETRAPIPAEGKLQLVPWPGLPADAVRAINENVERLNTLLFGPLDYAVIARR